MQYTFDGCMSNAVVDGRALAASFRRFVGESYEREKREEAAMLQKRHTTVLEALGIFCGGSDGPARLDVFRARKGIMDAISELCKARVDVGI